MRSCVPSRLDQLATPCQLLLTIRDAFVTSLIR
jgi:hypothetical protein